MLFYLSKEGSLELWLPFGFHHNTSYALWKVVRFRLIRVALIFGSADCLQVALWADESKVW